MVFKVKTQIVFMVFWFYISPVVLAVDYDANDFATEVIEYIQGTGVGYDYITFDYFNDPNSALGRPTVDTLQDDMYHTGPVLPIYPAYRAFEIVTIGNGGRLTLKFNHIIGNNPNNPYGVDFIIYGNSLIGSGWWYYDDNPGDVFLDESVNSEPGIVSVSQDGVNWYTFSNGPYADGFAPTLGRIYNPSEPNTSLGEWNLWWGGPTNPTMPLDPSLSPQDFNDRSLAQVCQIYGKSAGGTGFDIGTLALDWIQYVQIEDNPGNSNKLTEIDAVAIVKPPYPQGDLNQDCRVDFVDFAILAQGWLITSDWNDLAVLSDTWLLECE